MPIRVPDHLAYCITGGRAVFMDIERGRYFALPERSDAHFRGLVSGEFLPGSDQEALEALTRSGIFVDAPDGMKPARLCPAVRRPQTDLSEGGYSASLALCARAVIAELRAAHWIRTYQFGPLIARLASLKSSTRMRNSQDHLRACGEIASALSTTALIIPTRDRCLVRSIAFLQMALSRRVDAHLVFGVSVDPFAAHCWVQSGDHVLNDRYERVRAFTPILCV